MIQNSADSQGVQANDGAPACEFDDDRYKQILDIVFSKTHQKLSPQDPTIQICLALEQYIKQSADVYLQNTSAQLERTVFDLITQIGRTDGIFEDKIQQLIDIAGGIAQESDEKHQKASEQHQQFIVELERKISDLNFVLNRIQVEYDKNLQEQFNQFLNELRKQNDKLLKIQVQEATKRQREYIIAGIGFLAGLVVCLLVFLLFFK